jgi:photosystem II stability/assembly factor-like uncharacterized protein
MDVRELLRDAADAVEVPADLAERAEYTYRRRVRLQRAAAVAVAFSLLALVGVAVGLARDHTSTIAVGGPDAGPPVAVQRLGDAYYLDASQALAVTSDDDAVIAVTHDGGATWNRVGSLGAVAPAREGREIVFFDSEDGFVRTAGVLHVTHDAGRTWRVIDGEFLSIAPARVDDSMWALTGCRPGEEASCVPTVAVSNDRGATWHAIPDQPTLRPGPHQLVAISADAAYLADIATANGSLWRSEDGGRSWSSSPLPCQSGTRRVAGPTRGVLWALCVHVPSASRDGALAYRSFDNARSWTRADGTGDARVPRASPVGDFKALSDQRAVLTVAGSVYATENGGVTWDRVLTLPGGSAGVLGVRSGLKVWLLTTPDSRERGLWTSGDGSEWDRIDAK